MKELVTVDKTLEDIFFFFFSYKSNLLWPSDTIGLFYYEWS